MGLIKAIAQVEEKVKEKYSREMQSMEELRRVNQAAAGLREQKPAVVYPGGAAENRGCHHREP